LALAAEAPAEEADAAPEEPEHVPASDPSLAHRLEELEAKERAREEERAKKDPFVVSGGPGKGITVRATDDSYASTLRFRVQIRDTFAQDPRGFGTNEAVIKTLRLVDHGHVLDPSLRYVIQLAFGAGDFEKDVASPIFDAYVEYTKARDFNLRVGQSFVPFDRARTTREFALQLVDRQQIVREMTLDRDVGVMVSSSDFLGTGGVLSYNLFAGGGEGKNRFGGQKPGPLLVARVSVRPFGAFDDDQEADIERLPRPRLAIGVGAAENHGTNRQQSTYGTTFQTGTATYRHGAADVVFKWAGFSLLAEGLLRKAGHDAIDGIVDGKPVREWTRSGYGYFVQAGMMTMPRLEVVGRWEQMFAYSGTDPAFVKLVGAQGKQLGGGANLYVSGHLFKIQGDYFYGFGDDASEAYHTARVQLDATF
jgi:hypothetical protein